MPASPERVSRICLERQSFAEDRFLAERLGIVCYVGLKYSFQATVRV